MPILPPGRIAVITDELSNSLSEALRLLMQAGLTQVEIRNIGEHRVPDFGEDTVREARDLLDDAGVRVVGLSPGIGKLPEALSESRERLRRTIAVARELEATSITLFGFGQWAKARGGLDSAIDVLAELSAACRAAGLDPVLEISGACAARTVDELVRLVTKADLGLTWDPGNAAAMGAAELIAPHAALLPRIRRVHVKGFDPPRGWCDPGEGTIDWSRLLTQFDALSFVGLFVIEPHQPARRLPAFQTALRFLTNRNSAACS